MGPRGCYHAALGRKVLPALLSAVASYQTALRLNSDDKELRKKLLTLGH